MPPPRSEFPSEERLEPKREVKETRKEGEEEVPEHQEKGEQEEGRERSRRAAAVKATQTLQANESVSGTWEPGGSAESPGAVGGRRAEQEIPASTGFCKLADSLLACVVVLFSLPFFR